MSFHILEKRTDADLLKVVVIDDDLRITDFFKLISKQYLSNEMNLVATFNSAVEALKDPILNDVNLIFLDLDMPQVDGLQFIQQLDTDSKSRIVIISSKAEKFQFSEYPNVYGILPKPISIKEIKNCLNGIKAIVKSEL